MIRLSRQQVREIDRRAIEEFGVPGIVLMENAGRSAAEFLISLLKETQTSSLSRLSPNLSTLICCGKGNNGGDGFVIARHLNNRGIPVRVLLFAQPADLSGDAAVNFSIIKRSGLPIRIQPPKADLPAELTSAT